MHDRRWGGCRTLRPAARGGRENRAWRGGNRSSRCGSAAYSTASSEDARSEENDELAAMGHLTVAAVSESVNESESMVDTLLASPQGGHYGLTPRFYSN